MFTGSKISDLVDLFQKRQVKIFHSTQYIDFLSYLELGGIPSRSLLEERGQKMTGFVSDENDRINKVWDKVFFNPLDFGEIFQKGKGVPTVYGPIAFTFDPHALLVADNIAICLRSAGCDGFVREEESLKSIDDVDRIFLNPYSEDQYLGYKNSLIKFANKLKEEFNRDYVSYPEISIEINGNLLKFSRYLTEIKVDPYIINKIPLYEQVKKEISTHKIQVPVRSRSLNMDSRELLTEIVKVLTEGIPALDELGEFPNISDSFKQWVRKLKELNLNQQWMNYARYFRNGTLFPLLVEKDIR